MSPIVAQAVLAAYLDPSKVLQAENLIPVLIVVVVAVAGMLASRNITRIIRATLMGSSAGEVSIVVNIARAIVFAVVVYFVGENVFHVELGGVAQALGVTTLVVSLGLQDLIKNVVAGVQIVITHLFSTGDQLMLGDGRGEVRTCRADGCRR